jgi:uncharacterized protein YigE (DUF2233 family)
LINASLWCFLFIYKTNLKYFHSYITFCILAISYGLTACTETIPDNYISYVATPQAVKMFYKNENGKNYGSLQNLRLDVESKGGRLLFAMNGGMYKQDRSPQGLYIEEGSTLALRDTAGGNGNFYLKPNGIFYITKDNKAGISATSNFSKESNIRYATQSGPILVIEGKLHPAVKEGSPNVQVRNGVGILPDGKIIFAMSKVKTNFYDFAEYFRSKGCRNVLYLDGFVSRTYLPEQRWIQEDGNFGVIIGVTK